MLNKFFKRPKQPRGKITFPDGCMVETEKSFYFFKGQKRYRATRRIAKSWNLSILPSLEKEISHIPLARSPLGFRDGTLINNIADGRLYLISGNKRRHIVSPDVFRKYGFDRGNIIVVSDKETNLHEEGAPLE